MQVQTNVENSKMYRLHPGLTAHFPLLPSSQHVAKELLPCHDENYGGMKSVLKANIMTSKLQHVLKPENVPR